MKVVFHSHTLAYAHTHTHIHKHINTYAHAHTQTHTEHALLLFSVLATLGIQSSSKSRRLVTHHSPMYAHTTIITPPVRMHHHPSISQLCHSWMTASSPLLHTFLVSNDC